MAATDISEPDVNSLSAHQVQLLLRTVRVHRAHLSSAHEDALRWARQQVRPAYLLDFDLLYSYTFRYEEEPESALELEYLVDQPDVTLIIGPGTHVEIERMTKTIRRTRPTFTRSSDLRRDEQNFGRLLALLEAPNLVPYDQFVPDDRVDGHTFELVKATLQRSRRRATEHANEADALNSAAVIHMRRCSAELSLEFFPYLLTGTAPLLRDHAMGLDEEQPLARDPSTAIYSDVLFRAMPDANQAVEHTSDMDLIGAQVQHRLRHSPAYMHPADYGEEPDWEDVITNERVGEGLRAQLRDLAKFVDDPIVYQAQQIYERAQRSATSVVQQHHVGSVDRFESPRKLFELITGITAALEAGASRSRRLGGLWDIVLELRESAGEGFITYDLHDRVGKAGKSPYFSVEVHYPSPERDQMLFVLRWPGSADAESLVEEFHRAFRRHRVSTIELAVGTSRGVYEFEVQLPTSVIEMSLAVEAAVADDRGSQVVPTEISWLRMNAHDFDLYADVTNPTRRDALIGVFISEPDSEHIAELYERTSARYLFSAWLREALQQLIDRAVTKQSLSSPNGFRST
jgi:hypothetical protein